MLLKLVFSIAIFSKIKSLQAKIIKANKQFSLLMVLRIKNCNNYRFKLNKKEKFRNNTSQPNFICIL